VTDDLVGLDGQERHRLACADRHRDDDPSGAARAQRAHGGQRRQTGGETVVDDDRRRVPHLDRSASGAVSLDAAVQLNHLALHRGVERLLIHADAPGHRRVEHGGPAFGDCPHSKLRVPRRTELAHDQHVQRRRQCPGDLVPHGHAAARQGNDDGFRRLDRPQPLRQQAPRLAPVGEHPRGHLTPASAQRSVARQSSRASGMPSPVASASISSSASALSGGSDSSQPRREERRRPAASVATRAAQPAAASGTTLRSERLPWRFSVMRVASR
jgi:hypothetical protein